VKQAIAYLEYEINVDCPHCKEEVDLVKLESDAGNNSISARVFTNRWDDLIGWFIECPHCKSDFELERLDY
jgi:phage FluMu protein Com